MPGNVPINRRIDQLLQHNSHFSIAYINIDNFKIYSDQYGYSKGDLVIELLAQIIQSEIEPAIDFVGHIGGDDFIVLFANLDSAEAAESILRRFSQRVRHYYLPEHLQMGGFSAMDRLGAATFYPLITLSIGLASAAKLQAKKQVGESIFINKRRAPDIAQPALLAQADVG
nr:GGDEF domain-containing protein [Rheinheimera maricola]